LKTIETLKKLLVSNITDIEIRGKKDEVYYKERYADDTEEYVTFDQLASGYKGLINLAGDMILRLFEQQPDVHNPADLVGIVIIDELDLHLHPKLQRVLPTLLSDCFPKIQFIVSTHSPIPILGAPKESVFLKVTRTKEEGIKIVNLDHIAVLNLTPNTILTSPFFDFDDTIAETNSSLQDLRTEKTYKEVIFNQVLEEKLKELGSNSKFSQLFASE
jgi:predicted ATP-binding protein involved in virulence